MIDLDMRDDEGDTDHHFKQDEDHHQMNKPILRFTEHGSLAGVVCKNIDKRKHTDTDERKL